MASIDRLSVLPDEVICHILSFLPTKNSVVTSILAKRWRFLWAYVPILDFDSRNHDTEEKYPDIINRVMLLHKAQSINTFRLSFMDDCTVYQLETWIVTAIAHYAQKIDLYLCYQVMLPQSLFTRKTLVDLRLHSCKGIPSSGVVSLPSLKKLRLYSVQYLVKEALPHMLSGCPVLEELIIDDIMDQTLIWYYIFSSTIKKLILNFQFDTYEPYSRFYKVDINAPALRYLQLQDSLFEHISFVVASLMEANICINNSKVEDYNYTLKVFDFVDSLCNVKYLKLSSGIAFNYRAFADPSKSFTRFSNLTKLELAASRFFLPKFLESADNLEVLIVSEVDRVHLKYWMEPKQVPKCLLINLKNIRIDQFGCSEHEFNMVKYFLRNARVLKRMDIFFQHDEIDFTPKHDAHQRISVFERGSEACQIAFY